MKKLAIVSTLLLMIPVGVSGQSPERPNLTGTWSLDKAKSQLVATNPDSLTWVIEQSKATIRISEKAAGQDTSQYECSILGKECSANGSPPRKLSMYFNGVVLTQFDTVGAKGDSVIRREIKLSEDKKTLEVNVSHIVPEQKSEKLVFLKQ